MELVDIVLKKEDVMRIMRVLREEKVHLETKKKQDRKKLRQDYYINERIEMDILEDKLLYFLNNKSFNTKDLISVEDMEEIL